jgi:hypothetical protein
MTNQGTVIERLTGQVNFQDQSVRMQNASGDTPSAYAPYETRYVKGWNYVPIDRALKRPSALRATARWVAFRPGYPNTIPVPGPLNPPAWTFEVLDALRTNPPGAARFVGPSTSGASRVQLEGFTVGRSTGVWTLSLDGEGRIDGINFETADHSGIRATFTYTNHASHIEAPPSDEVQQLAPSQDLYRTP